MRVGHPGRRCSVPRDPEHRRRPRFIVVSIAIAALAVCPRLGQASPQVPDSPLTPDVLTDPSRVVATGPWCAWLQARHEGATTPSRQRVLDPIGEAIVRLDQGRLGDAAELIERASSESPASRWIPWLAVELDRQMTERHHDERRAIGLASAADTTRELLSRNPEPELRLAILGTAIELALDRAQLDLAVSLAKDARRTAESISDARLCQQQACAWWLRVAVAKGYRTESRERAEELLGSDLPRARSLARSVRSDLDAGQRVDAAPLLDRRLAVEAMEIARAAVRDEFGDGSFVESHRECYDALIEALLVRRATVGVDAAGQDERTRLDAEIVATIERARARYPRDSVVSPGEVLHLAEHLDGSTVISAYPLGERLVVSRLGTDGVHVITVPWSRELDETIATMIRGRSSFAAASRSLHAALWTPIASGIAERIYWAPYGPLRRLPVDALLGPDGPICLQHTIITIPRIPTAISMTPRDHRPPRLLALIDPVTDYDQSGRRSLPALPAASDGLPGIFPPGEGSPHRYFMGSEAVPTALAQGHGFDLIHLACHGEFHPLAPWSSVVYLAGRGRDGRYSARSFRDLDLSGVSLVTLAGCETGLAGGRGDDLAGFARAALDAGAGAVIGSLRRVEDAAAGNFMARLYQALADGALPPEAMRTAKSGCWTSDDDDDLDPHQWAIWVLLENGA